MRDFATVLLAEDEEHDVFFMERAFARVGIKNPLVPVPDGEQAVQYLAGEGKYADRQKFPQPLLLLLDLKMPLKDGFEVLSWIKNRPDLKNNLTVIVLSSSDQDLDKRKAFDLGAQEFLVKPSEFKDLVKLVDELKRRWIERSSSRE